MKRMISLIAALLLVAALVSPAAFAASYNTEYVVDKADLYTAEEEAALSALASTIGDHYNCSVIFLTSNDLEGYSTKMEYADDYYDYNNYKPDGILVYITLEDENNMRGIWTSTTGKCIRKFNEDEQDAVYEKIKSDLSAGNYYDAMVGYADDINYYMAPRVPFKNLLIALAVGFVIAVIIALGLKKQLQSVAMQHGAKNYVRDGSMQVSVARDTYLYSTVTRTARPKNNSSTHSGSSSTSHGGSGHSF